MLAASSLARGSLGPPASGPWPAPTPQHRARPSRLWAPGSQLQERGPTGTLWVPSTSLCGSPFPWSEVGWGPALCPRPHRSSHSEALHTRVFHTLRMPGETPAQAGAGGHRGQCSALIRGRGQVSRSLSGFGRRSGHPRVVQVLHESPRPYFPHRSLPRVGPSSCSAFAAVGTWTPGRAYACTGALRHLLPWRPPLLPLDLGVLWADLALPRSPELLRLIVPGTWEPPDQGQSPPPGLHRSVASERPHPVFIQPANT